MATITLWISSLFSLIWIYPITAQEEYCIDDWFNPQCQPGETILMRSAVYGRMRVGRCIPADFGNMGCQSDVLELLDEECSGKTTCNVAVSDKRITAQSGCLNGLLSFLQAQYTCVKGLNINSHCTSHQSVIIEAKEPAFYLSDMQLQDVCSTNNQGFTVKAREGQILNISQVNLQHTLSDDDVYGTVSDLMTDKTVIFGNGQREKHLLRSSANDVELKISESKNTYNRFMLYITVSGCPNVPPPDGAWMTRDGDVMEIGCHSGAKVWSLKCQNNQWVGAVGQCGEQPGSFGDENPPKTSLPSPRKLSINVMLFGISSIVIFLSAVIFLVGVCLLKRKIQAPMYSFPPDQKAVQLTVPRELLGDHLQPLPVEFATQQRLYPAPATATEPGYRSLRQSRMQQNARVVKGDLGDETVPAYMNTAESDVSDSLKYFVLEDTANYQ